MNDQLNRAVEPWSKPENWLPVAGYESRYEVSSLGRIRNKRRLELLYSKLPKGYSIVSLFLSGRSKTFKVSRIVAKAFLPNPENKAQVNHLNGIKDDDRAENLEWATPSENLKHAWDNRLRSFPVGLNPSKKISREQALEIRRRAIAGERHRLLAAEFGISHSNVSLIRNERTWA